MRHGTKSERDRYYSQHLSKAQRITRYMRVIIREHPDFNNYDIMAQLKKKWPSFKMIWNFVQLVRVYKENYLSEASLLTEALVKGYITKRDLSIRKTR